jgi:type II secretory pathway pseudopilin PulG
MSFRKRHCGFTLLEMTFAMSFSAILLILLFDVFTAYLARARFIAASAEPFRELTRLRYDIQRDVGFADSLQVTDGGSTLIVQGYTYYTTYRVQDTVTPDGTFQNQVDDTTTRFEVRYTYVPGTLITDNQEQQGFSGRIYRYGPSYDERRMEMLPSSPPVGVYLVKNIGPTADSGGTPQPIFTLGSFQPSDLSQGAVHVLLTYQRTDVVPVLRGVLDPQWMSQQVPFDSWFLSRVWESRR